MKILYINNINKYSIFNFFLAYFETRANKTVMSSGFPPFLKMKEIIKVSLKRYYLN